MQPYVNPNYFGQMTQFQQPNPYMDRYNQLQQFQQSLQQPMQQSMSNQPFQPLGKMVESVDMVKATDIPMDGSMYYFPTADGSAVFGKQWLPNGTTRILAFKPVLEDNTTNSPYGEKESLFGAFNDVLMGIQEDIKALSDKVDKIGKPTRTKKEVSDDE